MMRVMLTGATGFIGTQVRAALEARPDTDVHAVTRQLLPSENRRGLSHWHDADLLEEADIAALLRAVRPTHLVHLAWVTEHGKYWHDPANEVWADAGVALLRRFGESGGDRAVLAGTCAEYAWGVGNGICREDSTPVSPATPYGRAKDRLRRQAEVIAADHGLSLAWARLFQLYGPGESPRRLAPSVIIALMRGETARCSAGTQVRDFLHVSEAAAALSALLRSDIRGPINVGSGAGISVRTFVETIAAQFGPDARLSFGDVLLPRGEPPALIAGVERLRAVHRPRVPIPLAEGLRQTVDWWRSAGTCTA